MSMVLPPEVSSTRNSTWDSKSSCPERVKQPSAWGKRKLSCGLRRLVPAWVQGSAASGGRAAKMKGHIRRNGNPEHDDDPDPSLEDVVAGEQFRPRMVADKVEKENLERHGKRGPPQPDCTRCPDPVRASAVGGKNV